VANVVYPKFKQLLAQGEVDLETDDLRAVLVDTADYTYDAAHDFLNDIPAGARVATSGTITGRAVTVDSGNAVLDATDTTVNAVSGDTVEAIVVFKHTGVEGTSALLWYLDRQTDGTTPIALTPNGGDVTIEWSNGASKVLRIS
jgi:hypothetical protein